MTAFFEEAARLEYRTALKRKKTGFPSWVPKQRGLEKMTEKENVDNLGNVQMLSKAAGNNCLPAGLDMFRSRYGLLERHSNKC